MCICNICIHKCASHIHNRYPMPFSKLLWEVAPNAAPAPALRPHRGTPWRCGESILSKHIWIIDYHHQKNRCSMELHQNRLPVWKDMKIDVWRLIFLFAHTSSGSLYIWICMRFVLAIRVSPGNATESSGLVKATMPMWSQSGFRFVGGISSEHIQTISSERTKPYIYIIYIYICYFVYIYISFIHIYISIYYLCIIVSLNILVRLRTTLHVSPVEAKFVPPATFLLSSTRRHVPCLIWGVPFIAGWYWKIRT